VPSVGDRPPRRLARQTLAEIVEPRYEELFNLIARNCGGADLRKSSRPASCTGGAPAWKGHRLAEEIFHVPVRLGCPAVRGLADAVQNPIYSTAVGLLLYARENAAPRARSAARQRHGRGAQPHEELVSGSFLIFDRSTTNTGADTHV